MNIKLSYLYRDGSNYKQYNQIIFDNPNSITLKKIRKIIRRKLIEECWFIAKDRNLPDMHFKEYPWNNDVDHEWHEFDFIEETTEAKTVNTSIEDLIELIK